AAYLYALARWMESGGSLPAEDPVGRLAALESILYTTRAALERAPRDPVLGGFYRTALAQREAMITQVDMTMEDEWY
ncbi:MAG TPA: hypothetical protein VM778_14375, partial [Gemmatimonadota bacterium]|nr:hypothetical protein [Gemmatimonadota bacterium]